VAELRRALLAAVTDDDIKYMAGVLVQMARGGDLAAVKLLFSYVIGKPVEVSDPDRLDLEEWRLRQEAGVSAEQMTGVLDKMPADMANRLTAASHPYLVEQNFAGPFLRELEEFSGNDQLPLPKRCNGEAGVERQAAEAIVLPPASSTIIDNVGQRSVLGGKRQRRAGRAR
jgi:hypothetical protein